MTTHAENELLTRTGPGTEMGDLFRRYWIPVLRADEIPAADCPPVRVQVLGERLIAFRDTKGRVGLIDEFCAHRGVSLWFGRNEECGLRCAYHGWKYDVTGQCVELPSEPEESGIRAKVRLKAYPTLELGDVIWAYLGPPALEPEPPAFEWALVKPEQRFISKRLQECNYLQALEGGIDSSHVTFLHAGALKRDRLFVGSKGNEYNQRDPMPHFEVAEFEGGLLIAARRKAEAGHYYWRVTPWVLPFHTFVPPRGAHPIGAHAWVPIDDESCWTWSFSYHPRRALSGEETSAMRAGAGIHVKYQPGTFLPLANKRNDYLMDRTAQAAGISASGVEGVGMQDASIQESMGTIADRSRENLVATDRGIVMTRRLLLRAAKANREGRTFPGLDAKSQRVRSCATVLPEGVPFVEGARHGLFAELGTDPVTV
ncbi:MAG TPA: aromatic ring-hydroxylating dioxygenase subunit alpha [Alphaproteobacteria bacterium]|nr:aromatic ring-hydroxylating dioxygenase subunit alpha [Alphaproteobacteria bacterium]